MATYGNFLEDATSSKNTGTKHKYDCRKEFPRNSQNLSFPCRNHNTILNNNATQRNFNGNVDSYLRLDDDDNRKHLGKLKKLFMKKNNASPGRGGVEKNYSFNTLSVRTLENNNYLSDLGNKTSACVQNASTSSATNQIKRTSFHQDADEALNSLLWQPYEYQNRQNSHARTQGNFSDLSDTSSNTSYNDLDEYTNNEDSSEESSGANIGNVADLHLTTEMVNNLAVSEKLLHQCIGGTPSRDLHSVAAASRLSVQSSLSEKAEVCLRAVDSTSTACDGYSGHRGGDMQNDGSSVGPLTHPQNVITIPSNHGLNASVNAKSTTVPQLQSNKSISISNLSSANVVGLPSHPRHGSVPVSTSSQIRNQAGNCAAFSNHPRNVSEPSTMSANQFRYSNQVVPISSASVVPIHQRRSSQIDQSNLQIVNHLRSASVPKSMSTQQKQIDNTKVPPANISNVNVNFYRAVPVNVVSSVPTIQCLNTLEVGNNVSNVQIMPLAGTNSNHTGGTTNNHIGSTSNNHISSTTNNHAGTTIHSNTFIPTFTSTISGTTQVTVHNTPAPTQSIQISSAPPPLPPARARTFTSTEAQTDEISVCPPENDLREQRRRDRRERRHNRRLTLTTHRHREENSTQTPSSNDRLPDLLNNHLPPPYTPSPDSPHRMVPHPAVVPPPPPPGNLVPGPMVPPNMLAPPPPGTVLQTVVPNNIVPSGLVPFPPPTVVPGQVPLMQGGTPVAVPIPASSGFRFSFPAGGFRRGRFSEDPPKGCCGLLTWKPGSLRWFIALIALVAVCCVLVGTALGAMRPAGRDHLTVSLLMIGVGIVLVTVSGVAWRLTSHDSSTCRSMLGMGSTESVDVCTRRFVPRLPPSYGRPHHPYAAMMYPEFQYRPPPPSYQASMQEYRLRLLLLDRGNTPQIQASLQNAVSPPPTYRSHSGSLLRAPLSARRDATQSEYSCPPSYRSQNSTNRQGAIPHAGTIHSREQSLSLSESNNGESVVNIVSILGGPEEDIALDNITLDSLKMEPEADINPLKMLLKGNSGDLEGSKDGNLVTIVQTSDHSPVIVTVSGSSNIDRGSTVQITEIPNEMEILAHL